MDLVFSESIRFGDYRNQINAWRKTLHEFDIDGSQRVAGGRDEVDTRMDARVDNLLSVNTVLLLQISVESSFDVLQDRPPAIFIVDEVTESRRVDACQL